MASEHSAPRRLPVQQLIVLAIARFAEPIAMTSVFPYLPEMIESLGVEPVKVAKWAGIAAAIFNLSQAIFAISWGRASDTFGRKPAILTCLTGTMLLSILWGFSSTLPMALTVRALQGIFNGNVGVLRTVVAELVPFKELQPRAFSAMPLVYNIGSIFGPTLGGALANPKRRRPGDTMPEHPGLLDKYPYCLPNLFAAGLFIVGIVSGTLFLDETLETKRGQRDYGREIGKRLTRALRRTIRRAKAFTLAKDDPERERLLKPSNQGGVTNGDEDGAPLEIKKSKQPPPSFRECLTPQSVLNLFCYTLLAMHNLAFEQLIPIFLHYPRQDHTPSNPDFKPPLKFSGGFGLDSASIGFLFSLYGISGIIIQFFIFPPLARKIGVVSLMRLCSVCMPIVYFLVPFSALVEDRILQQVAGFLLMASKGFFSTIAFPCSTILLTDSASSLRILGTLNGIAVSVSAIGRAAGPAMTGAVFTLGVQRGYVIAPWWFLTAIAAFAAIPVFWIVEGEGFGGDTGHVEDSDTEDEEDDLVNGDGTITPIAIAAPVIESGAAPAGSLGGMAIAPQLSRQSTVSSEAISEEDETFGGASPLRYGTMSSSVTRPSGRRRVSRKVSGPIGMGSMSRRYSSNLGQSLGSAGGH